MRRDVALRAALLLHRVELDLEGFGRPRKPPGKPRPASDLGQYSLPELLRLKAKECNYSKTVRKTAAKLIVEKYLWHPLQKTDDVNQLITNIDNWQPDTREIVRAIRRARREAKKVYLG